MRALPNQPGKRPSAVSREWSFLEPKQNYLVSLGGKFTSARQDSSVLIDRVMALLKKQCQDGSPTKSRPFPWSPPLGEYHNWLKQTTEDGVRLGLDQETAHLCCSRYGTSIREIHQIVASDRSLSDRIAPQLPFCKAEIINGVINEMALSLEDILRRRIPFFLLHSGKQEILEGIADLIAPLLNWTEEVRQQEIKCTLKKWNKPWSNP